MSILTDASLIVTPNAVKSGSLLAVVPSNGNGDLTWTRNSGATRVNSAGLIENVPYNLVSWSEQFEDASWAKTRCTIISDSTIAPNGTLTADSIIQQSGQTTRGFVQKQVVSSIIQYTYSIFAKKQNKNFLVLTDNADGIGFINSWFNLNTGTVGTIGVNRTATIQNFNNGWYKCSITVSANQTTLQVLYGISDIDNDIIVTDSGGIYVWGAQLTEDSTPKDYLPTTTRLNIPRLDHSLGGCPSILLEPQRTNLVLRSEEFENASWAVNTATVTANSTISPSGLMNADTITNISGSLIGQNPSLATIGQMYTFSIYIKRINGNGLINLVDVNGNLVPITITNEWKRYNVTATASSTSLRAYFRVMVAGDSIAAWGAQLEQGAYPTSYIPTVASTVTRVADIFSRNNIFTNGLISASGGTWFVELDNNLALVRDSGGFSLYISDIIGTNNGLIIRNVLSTNNRLSITKRISSTETTLFTTTTNKVKIAITWNGTTANVFVNGVKVVTNTAFTTTNMEFLNGNDIDVPKYIKQMWLENVPMSDTKLIAATTL